MQEEKYEVFVPQTQLEIPNNLSSEQFLIDCGNDGINHFITCLQTILLSSFLIQHVLLPSSSSAPIVG